jgi:hypothetical protein
MEITLDELIRDVMARADDTLIQLEAASQRAVELDELGDALLNHFVDRSRMRPPDAERCRGQSARPDARRRGTFKGCRLRH